MPTDMWRLALLLLAATCWAKAGATIRQRPEAKMAKRAVELRR